MDASSCKLSLNVCKVLYVMYVCMLHKSSVYDKIDSYKNESLGQLLQQHLNL